MANTSASDQSQILLVQGMPFDLRLPRKQVVDASGLTREQLNAFTLRHLVFSC